MKFIDECVIKLAAGTGGDGFIDFAFDNFTPTGGPGGNGGAIYVVGTKNESTLLNISAKREYFATNGQKGGQQNTRGKNGQDLFLSLPWGTKIYYQNELIKTIDSTIPFLIVKGGKGGKGNKGTYQRHQKTKNYDYEKGAKGQTGEYKLTLDTIADVGFVGKPSAGKSTILTAISNTKAKVGSYDFTTLKPQLGLVRVSEAKSFVAVDLPGLIGRSSIQNEIEKATLKMIAKCKTIAYVLDFGDPLKDPIADFEKLKAALKNYASQLEELPIIIVANKMDQPIFYQKLKRFTQKYFTFEIVRISGLQKKNLKTLKYQIFKMLQAN